MRLKNIRNLALGLALILVVGAVGYKLGQKNQTLPEGNQFDLSLMWKVRNALMEDYLDRDKVKNDKELMYGSIEGMVEALDDPYTMFLPPEENKSANEDLAGSFAGVGIQLGYKEKTLAAMSIIPKSPAEAAGVKAGDLILKIVDKANKVDKDTTGISLDGAVKLIRGEKGTEVTLTLYREGKAGTFDMTLKRDDINVPGLEMEWKEVNGKKIAWIKFYKFSEQIFNEWPEIVSKIEKEKGNNYGGIILDLRNNPGGYLQASVLAASDFLKEGVVVKQESSSGVTETYRVDQTKGNLVNDKLVVLINGGSASASEILAGALKDHNRAKLVGEKSFGKGTVQETKEFKDGSGIHITIAKWLLPNGKNIHKEGITPDVEVKAGDDPKVDVQLDKAIEVLLQ
ncbi:MAG: S41 family peptidase [Candidatus Shapirobacteria bacterium]|nr:S41 family peptidase [Candidatus Shapirobacteria bacterium]